MRTLILQDEYFYIQLNDPGNEFIIEFVDNIVNTLGIKEIDIELGNSVQIMHLGSIRQLNFCSEIKKLKKNSEVK